MRINPVINELFQTEVLKPSRCVAVEFQTQTESKPSKSEKKLQRFYLPISVSAKGQLTNERTEPVIRN